MIHYNLMNTIKVTTKGAYFTHVFSLHLLQNKFHTENNNRNKKHLQQQKKKIHFQVLQYLVKGT